VNDLPCVFLAGAPLTISAWVDDRKGAIAPDDRCWMNQDHEVVERHEHGRDAAAFDYVEQERVFDAPARDAPLVRRVRHGSPARVIPARSSSLGPRQWPAGATDYAAARTVATSSS